MFVVHHWVEDEGGFNWEGEWGHKYFESKENAEAYALKLREEDHWVNVELEEIQTED